nr:VanZ family protein [Collinsella tanakaei]
MREGASTISQIAFNVVLFMPLGFIAGRLLRWGFWRSVFTGLLASLFIEAAQGTGLFGIYPYAYRTADVDDLIYNTLGAALGWACATALARVLPPGALAGEGEVTHGPGLIRRCVALWLDATLMSVATLAVSAAVSLVLHNVPGAEAWADVPYVLLVAAAAFIWTECVHPWRHGGSTPGGALRSNELRDEGAHGRAPRRVLRRPRGDAGRGAALPAHPLAGPRPLLPRRPQDALGLATLTWTVSTGSAPPS